MQTTQNRTIILVSGEPDKFESLTLALWQSGCHILFARDGREGFRLARRERPDLVLSEINLSVISGLELCRTIKTDRELRGTPLMFLSESHEESDCVIEILRAGADDCLPKTSDPQYLAARIEWLIERKNSENNLLQNYKLLHSRHQQIVQIVKEAANLFRISENELKAVSADELNRREFEKTFFGSMDLGMIAVRALDCLLEKRAKDLTIGEPSRYAASQSPVVKKDSSNYECIVYELIDNPSPLD